MKLKLQIVQVYLKFYIKRFPRWLFCDACLFWLFAGVFAGAIYLPHMWVVYFSDINTVPVTVFLLQISAFGVFISRLNKWYGHYNPDPDIKGFGGAINKWFWSLKRKHASGGASSSINVYSESKGWPSTSINADQPLDQIIKEIEKRFNNIWDHMSAMESNFNQELKDQKEELLKGINELRDKQSQIAKKTSDLHMQNLGRELVAVLWLIVAALINSFPSIITCLYFI